MRSNLRKFLLYKETENKDIIIHKNQFIKVKKMNFFYKKVFFNFFSKLKLSQKTISILREFKKPPYGGGNQFMLA